MKQSYKLVLVVLLLALLTIVLGANSKQSQTTKEHFVTNIEDNGKVTVIYNDGRREKFPNYSQFLQGQYRREIYPWQCTGRKCPANASPIEGFENREFGTCPDGWTYLGENRCAKPDADSSNRGLCSEDIVDFSGYSNDMKREWTTQCSVTWANRKQLNMGNRAPFIETFEDASATVDKTLYGEPQLFINYARAEYIENGQTYVSYIDDHIAKLINNNEIDIDLYETTIEQYLGGQVQKLSINVHYVSFDKGYLFIRDADLIGTSRIVVKPTLVIIPDVYDPQIISTTVRTEMLNYFNTLLLEFPPSFNSVIMETYKPDQLTIEELFALIGKFITFIVDFDYSDRNMIIQDKKIEVIDKLNNIYQTRLNEGIRTIYKPAVITDDTGNGYDDTDTGNGDDTGIDSEWGNPSQEEILIYDLEGFNKAIVQDNALYLRYMTLLLMFIKIVECLKDDMRNREIIGEFVITTFEELLGIKEEELAIENAMGGELPNLNNDQWALLGRLSRFFNESRCGDLIERAKANRKITLAELPQGGYTLDTIPRILIAWRDLIKLQIKCLESNSLTRAQYITVVKYIQTQIEILTSIRFGRVIDIFIKLDLYTLLTPFTMFSPPSLPEIQASITKEEMNVLINILNEVNKLDCQTLLKRAETNTTITLPPTPSTPNNDPLNQTSSGLITDNANDLYNLRRAAAQKFFEWNMAFEDSCSRLNIQRTATQKTQDLMQTAKLVEKSMKTALNKDYDVPDDVINTTWINTLTPSELKVLIGIFQNMVTKCDVYRDFIVKDSAQFITTFRDDPDILISGEMRKNLGLAPAPTSSTPPPPTSTASKSREEAIAKDTSFLTIAGDIGKYLQDTTVKIVLPGDANILIPNGSTEYVKTTVKCDKNGGATTTTTPAQKPKTVEPKPTPTPKSKYDGKDVCQDPASLASDARKRGPVPGDSNFAYKPKYGFNHMEPTKEWADAYGWSFMPPQYWSVPQRRPPVCIPDKDTEATVQPTYTQGTPLDALDWNRPMIQKPSQEYKRNDNYYYPGWVAQEDYHYPFSGTTAEYYNLNKATSTKTP